MIRKITLFLFFLILIAVLFALYQNNPDPINFKFYGGIDTQIYLVIVVSVAFLIGMIIGNVSTYPKRMELKREIRKKNKELETLQKSLIKNN